MVHILYTNINKCFLINSWDSYLKKLPIEVKEYILKFQKQNDKLRVLCGKLLLQKALEGIGKAYLINAIQFDQYKRPFVSKDVDFNISHSGKYVVCSLSTTSEISSGEALISVNRIGIDIEKKRAVQYDEFERVFTADELQLIKEDQNPTDKFFEFWTMKEAVMKADGRGFHLSPASFTVLNNRIVIDDKTWYLNRIQIDKEYDCHVATEFLASDLKIKEIIF